MTEPSTTTPDTEVAETEPCLQGAAAADAAGRRHKSPLQSGLDSNSSLLVMLIAAILTLLLAVAIALTCWRILRSTGEAPAADTGDDERAMAAVYPPSFDMWSFLHDLAYANGSASLIARLPETFAPTHYDLQLNLTQFDNLETISGVVEISLQCLSTTSEITLHATPHITIGEWQIEAVEGSEHYEQNGMSTDESYNTVSFKSKTMLKEGERYRLKINFSTRICGEGSGVYCEREKNATSGRQRVVTVTTKFEPSLAKTFVPCLDEPQLKATFDVTLVHARHVTALTNEAVLRRSRDAAGFQVTRHRRTPPMSTYLLAIVVGRLVRQSARSRRGLALSVWTQPHDAAHAAYSLAVGTAMLDRLEALFGSQYALSKLDFVASRNFPVAGMENWGLVVFHYDILLVDEDAARLRNDSDTRLLRDQYKASKIVTHELLHQWFGNAVTMDWWSELWLNEGFASFYVFDLLRDSYPHLVSFEYTLRLSQVLQKQSASAKLPLVTPSFRTERDILVSFDQWNLYVKGCVMLQIMRSLVGRDVFHQAIVSYLRRHHFHNVDRFALLAEFGSVGGFGAEQSVESVMEPWLTNDGFPEVVASRHYSTGRLVVTQMQADINRHLVFLQHPSGGDAGSNWTIPLVYRSRNGATARQWLVDERHETDVSRVGAHEWLLVNPAFEYPYRVNYDTANWHLLTEQLHTNVHLVPEDSRVQLMQDATHFLSHSRHLPLFATLLSYLQLETELKPALFGVSSLFDLLETYQATDAFAHLVRFFAPAIAQLDAVFVNTRHSAEMRALWQFEENRLNQLSLLRCLASLPSCRRPLLGARTLFSAVDSGRGDQLAATCDRLYVGATERDRLTLTSVLRRNPGQLSLLLHMGACVRDARVADVVVEQVFASHTTNVLGALLSSSYTLHYNALLRERLWRRMGEAGGELRRQLARRRHVSRLMLHSVRTRRELDLAQRVIGGLWDDKAFLRAKLTWIETNATQLLLGLQLPLASSNARRDRRLIH